MWKGSGKGNDSSILNTYYVPGKILGNFTSVIPFNPQMGLWYKSYKETRRKLIHGSTNGKSLVQHLNLDDQLQRSYFSLCSSLQTLEGGKGGMVVQTHWSFLGRSEGTRQSPVLASNLWIKTPLTSEGDSDPLSSESVSWTLSLEPGGLLLEKLLGICSITKPKGGGHSASRLHYRCITDAAHTLAFWLWPSRTASSNIPAGPRAWLMYGRWKREAMEVSVLFTDRKGALKNPTFVCEGLFHPN